jgi:hypothetical protein
MTLHGDSKNIRPVLSLAVGWPSSPAELTARVGYRTDVLRPTGSFEVISI